MQHSGMMFPPRADRLGRTNHSVPLVHPTLKTPLCASPRVPPFSATEYYSTTLSCPPEREDSVARRRMRAQGHQYVQ